MAWSVIASETVRRRGLKAWGHQLYFFSEVEIRLQI